MKIKYFAYIRDYTKCKVEEVPPEEELSILLEKLSLRHGENFRQKVFTADQKDLGAEIIILINGRNVHYLGGLKAKLSPSDEVAIFPVVAGG